MEYSYEVNPEAAAEMLVKATPDGRIRKIILFGSRANGGARPDSDIDLLVIERDVHQRRREIARLRRALSSILAPFDILVYDESDVEAWGHLSGTVIHEALSSGKPLFIADG